jgi:CHAD domain-containing protein
VRDRLRDLRPDLELDVVLAALSTTRARAGAAFRRARAKGTAAAFHAWRKRTKDLRHQLRLFRPAWPRMIKGVEHELARLADLLGDDHDLFLLRETLQEPAPAHAADAAAIRALIATRRAELQRASLSLGARLFPRKHRAPTALLARWWNIAAAEQTPLSRPSSRRPSPAARCR